MLLEIKRWNWVDRFNDLLEDSERKLQINPRGVSCPDCCSLDKSPKSLRFRPDLVGSGRESGDEEDPVGAGHHRSLRACVSVNNCDLGLLNRGLRFIENHTSETARWNLGQRKNWH